MIDLAKARRVLIDNKEVNMTDRDRLNFMIRKNQRLLSKWVVRRDGAEKAMVECGCRKDLGLVRAFGELYTMAIVRAEATLKRLKLLRDLQYVMFFKSPIVEH